jgi:hypothetical protein
MPLILREVDIHLHPGHVLRFSNRVLQGGYNEIIEYSPIASSESRLYLRFIESLRVNALYSIEGIQTERVPSTTLAGLNVVPGGRGMLQFGVGVVFILAVAVDGTASEW